MVEIMSVMVILSLLAGLIMPRFWAARDKSVYQGCQQNLKSIATALQLYANENDHVFPTAIAQIQPQYLKILPTCPSVSADTYAGGYVKADSPSTFTLTCHGSNHIAVYGILANQPYYVYAQGVGP